MSLVEKLQGRAPRHAIILGSALGSVVEAVSDALVIPYGELPGFPVPKISGHAGKLHVGRIGGVEVAVLAGRAHPYESGNAGVMRPVLDQLKQAGMMRSPTRVTETPVLRSLSRSFASWLSI